MNNTFDYFRNLKSPEIFLCNPDKEKLAVLNVLDAHLTLRFNDLSELSLEVSSHATNTKGKKVRCKHYENLRAKRLILIDGVGYFRIMEVNEIENGLNSMKFVKASSLQIRLNDKGFFMEERVYKFFDPRDPFDENYCGARYDEVPSVVGQLHQQLGIEIDPRVNQGLEAIEQSYDEWTISYINPALRFHERDENKIVRSFTEQKTLWGYEFIMNYASQIFEVIFEFDFLRQSIQIKTVEEVTGRTNIYLSYDNVVSELQTTERMDELVTVLNCNGNNLDIRAVNPTGTNYITDFSYFMSDIDNEKTNFMSKELSQQLREWDIAVKNAAPEWTRLVMELRDKYLSNTEIKAEKVIVDKRILDLENALSLWAQAHSDGVLNGLENLEQLERSRAIFTAEDVKVGGLSLDEASTLGVFDRDTIHTCYQNQPRFIPSERMTESGESVWSGRFSFEEQQGRRATFNENYLFGSTNPSGVPQSEPLGGFIYFPDPVSNDNSSYCKLYGEVYQIFKPDPITGLEEMYEAHFWVAGFERYTTFNNAWLWLEKHRTVSRILSEKIDLNDKAIEEIQAKMNEISSSLNLTNFLNPKEFRELRRYWIENDYTSSGLAILDTTTPEEAIDLSLELLEEGRKHLAKNSRPRFSIAVDSIDFTKIYHFKAFSGELALGKVITIAKDEWTHYYPALTTISLNLLKPDNFLLEFSNALKPDSKDFLFSDLINESVSSARTVSANWQKLTQFNRQSDAIYNLLNEPLNRTLRIAQGNMNNQEFVVDETGILGRRINNDRHTSFESEQIRIINNVMLFTNDSWQTAKTALGKIHFNHPTNGETKAYGLLAEALVGSVIIGNTLYISNKENTITLDENGIMIKRPSSNELTFHAKPNGDVSIKGNIEALSGSIGRLTIDENGNLVSNNFSLSTDAGGITSLAVVGANDDTITTVDNLGVRSLVVDCGDLVVSKAMNIGGVEGFGGFTIDHNSIRAASGSIIFNDPQEEGFPQHYSANVSISLGTGGMVTTTVNITDAATGQPANLLREVSFTGTMLLTVFFPPPLGGTSANRSFRVTVGRGESSGTRTTSEGTMWTGVSVLNWALGTQSVFLAQTINFMQSPPMGDSISIVGNLLPAENERYDLGESGQRWNDVWAVNTWTSSDKALKNSIKSISENHSKLFDKLKPVTYKLKSDKSEKTRFGLIAQDVEKAIKQAGIDPKTLNLFHDGQTKKGRSTKSLNYTELISMCVNEIQKLKKRVSELDGGNDGI